LAIGILAVAMAISVLATLVAVAALTTIVTMNPLIIGTLAFVAGALLLTAGFTATVGGGLGLMSKMKGRDSNSFARAARNFAMNFKDSFGEDEVSVYVTHGDGDMADAYSQGSTAYHTAASDYEEYATCSEGPELF